MDRTADVIRSRSNPLVRRLRELKRQGAGELALLEGPKLLEEALRAGLVPSEVAASPRALEAPRTQAAVDAAAARGAVVRLLAEDVLASLSETETSQGVLALVPRPTFSDDAPFRGTPLLVVAIAIQNPGNLGGLLRTAEAAGATGALLTEGCADPFSWKALRGSMGSAFRLPHVYGRPVAETLALLRARGVATVATVASDAPAYHALDLRQPVAFLFGNEGAGLSEEIMRAANLRARVPMAGEVESLNVGVAAGVLLFEAARQRRDGRG
jgi:TrmH family RNA methyltransferase